MSQWSGASSDVHLCVAGAPGSTAPSKGVLLGPEAKT